MTTFPGRVICYTTNLTTPGVALMPKLGRWSGIPEVRMPKVVVVPKLGRCS